MSENNKKDQISELEHLIEETLNSAFADENLPEEIIEEMEKEVNSTHDHDHKENDGCADDKCEDDGCGDEKSDDCCGGSCGDGNDGGEWTKKKYLDLLNTVLDPETGIGIVDMGLIYDLEDREKNLDVKMTLTSMGCPMGPQIMGDVEKTLKSLAGAQSVKIDLTFEPAWNPDMMNPDVRAMLWGQ